MMKLVSPKAESDNGEGLILKMRTTIRNTVSSEALSGRTVFAALALAAAVAVGLMLMLPGSPLHAQDANTIEYPENGTGPVATFSSEDPDGDTITWSIVGSTDEDEFDIDTETGELTFKASPNYESPTGGTDGDSNTYEVTVTATDDGTGTLTATKDVKVKVTDVEERATISLSPRLPVVGLVLTATLGNADEVESGVRWTWEKKDGAAWVDVAGEATASTASPPASQTSMYTPAQSEIGAELRVSVQYIDSDDDNQAIAAVTFEHAVAASVGGTNVAPTFADSTAASRTIPENSPAGTAVGDPVTATDDHRAATALTYTMAQTNPAPTDDAPASFKIDSKTGQISVSASAKLNYDPVGSTAAVRAYTLMVTVADPDGGDDATFDVTVTLTDVAEAPEVTGSASAKVEEGTEDVGTYTGTDEAGDELGLTLEGTDASAFSLIRDGDDHNLAFNTAPDFEKPTDTGANNEYQVTVVATARGLGDSLAVVVSVTNMNEDGEIELSTEEPSVGMPVTAELTDEDMAQASTVTWTWSSNAEVTCNDNTDFDRSERVAGATSDTYTPTADECLRVTARYDDGHGANKSASATVEVGARTNNMPMFTDDDPIIRSVDENVDAGADVGSVEIPGTASPVVATDADNSPDTGDLTYTIVSVDPSSGAARFSIDNTGQLKAEEKLDYEDQASYVLEVKVTDSTSNSATVTVTVNVNNVNDDPGEIMDSRRNNDYAENGIAVVATFSSEDPDGDTITWSIVGSTDEDEFDIDAETGELTFKASPNYESPTGGTDGDSNTYEVTVTATDDGTGTLTATKDVKVKVTDVEERATISLSPRLPVVGLMLSATLGNVDEVKSGVRWTWTGIEGTPLDTQANSTYTPLPGDANDRISVRVEYIDTDDQEQAIAAVTFEHRVAPTLAEDAPNELPEFADGTAASRTIPENSPAGTAVGDPVTATDDHRAATALTYTMAQTNPRSHSRCPGLVQD